MNTGNNITNSDFQFEDKGPSEYFKGDVYIQGLVSPIEVDGLYSVGQLTFEPGSKTNWHTHPIGQVLLITEGKGWYQERGKPVQQLTSGVVVVVPGDVVHWHGAHKESRMIHIEISNMMDRTTVTWLEPVTDEEYNNL